MQMELNFNKNQFNKFASAKFEDVVRYYGGYYGVEVIFESGCGGQ